MTEIEARDEICRVGASLLARGYVHATAGYATLPGWSYRHMWWVSHNPHGAYMARGIHGQSIYVDPKAEMVIVRYAAHPVAANGANDPLTLPAFQAMGEALMRR